MSDPTDAEIQAGADAIARSWRVLSPTSRRHLAKLVLRAVLPGHDAQLRADERRRVAAGLLSADTPPRAMPQIARLCATNERRRVAEEIARAIGGQQ